MSKWVIVLSLLAPGAALAATAWTWVDEDGQRHFSDRPVPGAERVELAGAQGFAAQPASRPQRGPSAETDATEAGEPYRVLRITQPEPMQTLWNIEGTLDVGVEIEPALREGHEIDLLLDGERQYLNSRQTSFTLSEVWRGVHSIQAVVFGAGGGEIMRSPTTNFVVQQTSLLNPNNPHTSPPGVN